MASNGTNWYFTKEQLENSPSKQCGIDGGKELSFRQQAANFIQEMGQKLKVSQLCINTAIVYMHRFYVFHSFTRFPWNTIAAAAVLLAAKVEEQPRKLEHVIRVVNLCKNPNDKTFDTTSEKYLYQLQDLIFNENILLQTLGFEVAIDHPHTHVVRCCHLVRATKDLAHTSYFMASNSDWTLKLEVFSLTPVISEHAKKAFLFAYKVATKNLHLTTMCLQYKPTVVACFCIHFVCKWANWEIPLSNEKKQWFSYVDETVTSEILEQLANDFLAIYENCPSRLKEKIVALGEGLAMPQNTSTSASPFVSDKKPVTFSHSESAVHKIHYSEMKSFTADEFKHRSLKQAHIDASSTGQHHDREREYRDKKEREHAGHHFKPPLPNTTSSKHGQAPHSHEHHSHASSGDPKLNKVSRPQSTSSSSSSGHSSIVKNEIRDGKDVLASSGSQQLVRDKRDYNNVHHKPSSSDLSNLNSRSNSAEKLNSSSKSRPPTDPKSQPRHREESKPYNYKLESDIKKHLSAAIHDKSIIPTSQKTASEIPKSVPVVAVKQEVHNNNGNVLNPSTSDVVIKQEVVIKEEPGIVVPPTIKRPSLFSPEKTPPSLKRSRTKTPPSSGKKSVENEFLLGGIKRSRTSSTTSTNSSNSEPELRPVMKKIDQVEGFESLMHDSSIGIHASQQILSPDLKTVQNVSIAKELKPPDLIPPFNSNASILSQPIMNGIETTPTLISNLLKEAPTIPHLPVVTSNESKEHREHKKSKKEKHKHRSKEKHREEREKKRKHKDKDKEKHRHRHQGKESTGTIPTPIKITIPKDKIHNSDSSATAPPVLGGLKIKIPKDRIKTDTIGETSLSSLSTTSTSGGSLKIKISKDVINNFNSNSDVNNKKRDRCKDASLMVTTTSEPHKVYKSNHNRLNESRNTKNSYNNQVSNVNLMYNQMNVVAPPQQLHQQQTPSMYPPNQNYFYNSYPPNMQYSVPPPPPPYMYQPYYMYPPAPTNLYPNTTEAQPPLPHEPPPNIPPPPPPDA